MLFNRGKEKKQKLRGSAGYRVSRRLTNFSGFFSAPVSRRRKSEMAMPRERSHRESPPLRPRMLKTDSGGCQTHGTGDIRKIFLLRAGERRNFIRRAFRRVTSQRLAKQTGLEVCVDDETRSGGLKRLVFPFPRCIREKSLNVLETELNGNYRTLYHLQWQKKHKLR